MLAREHLWRLAPARGPQPLGDDRALLQVIARGEFTLNGFRNRDLQGFFFAAGARDPREARRAESRAWIRHRRR